MSQYIGAFFTELEELLMIEDGFTVGQKLTQIEKTANKRFIELSDKELYETIQKLRKQEYYQDQKLTPKEFEEWINSAVKN